MRLEADEIMKITALCEEHNEVRDDGRGYLRVIPIVGGSVEGRIRGEVVAGGADWNTSVGENYSHVFAKYMLKTEDGEYIAIENEGKISLQYHNKIKTSPRFQTALDGKYSWLNYGTYVASLEPGQQEGSVSITVYQMQ